MKQNQLNLCLKCVMQCQNMNNNKPIYRCRYDLQKNPKEEYVNGNIDWVPLCTNNQKYIFYLLTNL